MPITEHWQHKHPFTTLSYSLTFHFYWKSLQLLCLPYPIYRKQHSNWHSWDVWFKCMQKPEPVAPLPLVQGSCHESFLLILSLSRLQLQWHTHEICGICFPPPVCQVRATAPHPSQEQSGTTGVVIVPLDIARALSLGEELQQEHHAPLPWWSGAPQESQPLSPVPEWEEQAELQMGPRSEVSSTGRSGWKSVCGEDQWVHHPAEDQQPPAQLTKRSKSPWVSLNGLSGLQEWVEAPGEAG